MSFSRSFFFGGVIFCFLLVGSCSDRKPDGRDDSNELSVSRNDGSPEGTEKRITERGQKFVVPSGNSFDCTPISVWDGDGPIWCEEGPKIRLAGIAARELDNECKVGHPCPIASGIEARDTLVKLLGEPIGLGPHGHILIRGDVLRCVSTGSARGDRTGAWCSSASVSDVSCAMVRTGMALKWEKYWREEFCR